MSVLAVGSAWAQPAAGPRINVDVEDAALPQVLWGIGEALGCAVVCGPGASEERITVNLREIGAREALDVITAMVRADVEQLPGGSLVVHYEPRVTIQFTDANVRTVLQLLAAYSGKNIIISPEVTGSVTLDLREVRWDRALQAIANALDLQLRWSPDLVLVSQRELAWGSDRPQSRWGSYDRLEMDGPTVTHQAGGARLEDVAAALSAQTGWNVVLEAGVDAPPLNVEFRRTPWWEAVGILATLTGCEVERLPGRVVVLSQPPRVTIQFTDANVRTVLQLLAAYSGRTGVLGPEVDGQLTLDLKEVHWWRGLEGITAMLDAEVVDCGEDVYLVTGEVPAALQAQAPAPVTETVEPWVSIEVKDVDVATVADALGQQAGRNLLVEPGVEARVGLRLQDVPWTTAVELLARAAGGYVEVLPGGIYLIRARVAVSLSLVDANVRTALQVLAAEAGVNVVVAPEVVGQVTVDLRGASWRASMNAIAWALGYEIVDEGDDLLVVRGPRVSSEDPAEDSEGDSEEDSEADSEGSGGKKANKLAALRRRIEELEARLDALEAGSEPVEEDAEPSEPEVEPAGSGLDGASARELWELALELQGELKAGAEARDVERLVEVGARLEAVLERYEAHQDADAEALAGLRAELSEYDEVLLAVQLNAMIAEANQLLRDMAEALQSERFRRVERLGREVDALVERMRGQEREAFARNAEAVEERALGLRVRARELGRVASLSLRVSGVLVHLDGEGSDVAIVNDRVYMEGDAVIDANDEEVPGLVVVAIEVGEVRFRLDAQEFVRELEPVE